MNKYFKILPVFLMTLTFLGIKGQNNKLFEKTAFVNEKNEKLFYRLLKPSHDFLKSDKKYPLIIFLHGAGERGDDNEKQLIHGASLFTQESNMKKYPCFVIIPQCPKEKRWVEVSWKLSEHIMPEKISEPLRLTTELIDDFVKKYPVDINRIYLTGLSMGGFGTWDLISRFPDKFAAAAPVCGGGDENQADKIKNVSIWAFHGTKDRIVKVSRSRNMINAIKKSGGNPKYNEYQELGHGSWNAAYGEKDFFKWMFSQKLIIRK